MQRQILLRPCPHRPVSCQPWQRSSCTRGRMPPVRRGPRRDRAVRAAVPFAFDEIDIETDDALVRDYGMRIPVVAVDGEEAVRDLGRSGRAPRRPRRLAAVAPVLGYGAVTGTHAPSPGGAAIPDATVARLPLYLRALVAPPRTGRRRPCPPRRSPRPRGDLRQGSQGPLVSRAPHGTRGVGYDVWHLIHEIREELGLTQHWPIVIAGIGNLGQALVALPGIHRAGLPRRGAS